MTCHMQTNLIVPLIYHHNNSGRHLPPRSSMIPSYRARCRRRRNAAAGGTGATTRALAAGLWRHQHGSSSTTPGNRGRTQCPCSRNRQGDKYGSSSMEKATKWDRVYPDDIFLKEEKRSRSKTMVELLELELDMARARIVELEEERRPTSKRLERFLRMKEDLRLERKHRRELEAANARLLRELSEARVAAKQQARSYEMERKARELMEEACSGLTREVEGDQAAVELLRRECVRMREEMEEERRMLQVAEVWREERVQMKLSDAKLALECKYSQLNRLQAEMEAFLSLRRNKEVIGDAAARGAPGHHHVDHDDKLDVDSVFEHFRRKEKDKGESSAGASSSSNLDESVSPATDLFLAKADDVYSSDDDDDDGSAGNRGWVGTSDPSVSVAPSFSRNNHNNYGASRRSEGATKNTRRLWRTAISESRKKTGSEPRRKGDCWLPPASDRRSSVKAAPPLVAAEQCSSSGSVNHHQQRDQKKRGTQHYNKRGLKEKLMEARMDDQKEKTPFNRIR